MRATAIGNRVRLHFLERYRPSMPTIISYRFDDPAGSGFLEGALTHCIVCGTLFTDR
ncbi:hypothetical protein [Roseiflexus castenholzii]|uniref:hypothetical protein n=1 Tax=Roseiflexus castenholzii TaxID=120962 RepID=UPI0023559FB5